MRSIFSVLSIGVFMLALAGCQLPGSASLKGTYTTTLNHTNVPTMPELVGAWEITFGDDGKYLLHRAGLFIIQGEYTVNRDTLRAAKEVGVSACTDTVAAVYLWSISGDALTLKRLNDTCEGRAIVLALYPLRKKDS